MQEGLTGSDGISESSAVINGAKALGMGITMQRSRADVLVAEDPAQIGSRTMWAAVLRGGAIMSRDTLERPDSVGIRLFAFKAGLLSTRRVHVSEKVVGTQIHRLIQDCMRHYATSKWKMFSTTADFIEHKVKATSRSKAAEVWAVVDSNGIEGAALLRELQAKYREAMADAEVTELFKGRIAKVMDKPGLSDHHIFTVRPSELESVTPSSGC